MAKLQNFLRVVTHRHFYDPTRVGSLYQLLNLVSLKILGGGSLAAVPAVYCIYGKRKIVEIGTVSFRGLLYFILLSLEISKVDYLSKAITKFKRPRVRSLRDV